MCDESEEMIPMDIYTYQWITSFETEYDFKAFYFVLID